MAIRTGVQRRLVRLFLLTAFFVSVYFMFNPTSYIPHQPRLNTLRYVPSSFDWAKRPQKYPFDKSTMTHLPQGAPRELPRIQHKFTLDELSASHNETQRARRDAVRAAVKRSWKAYRDHAWGRDEVFPEALLGHDTFAGWGATLVDSLDALWIMGMKDEFMEAVRHVATIDWNRPTSRRCSLFETNIRFLGGLLSAYDLSQERVLLDKAIELGEMLYSAFDTPSHMPANDFHFDSAKSGNLVAGTNEASAAVGSMSLEFTRLSQLTGDPKYYSAIDGITRAFEQTQDSTQLPGLWPVFVGLRDGFSATGNSFTLGAAADSAYEYFSKMHALLGGLDPTYEKLHVKSMNTAKKHLLFRPMLPEPSVEGGSPPPDILFSGTARVRSDSVDLQPEVQHLGCFAGGMFALGGRLFGQDEHVRIGEQLARGCAWAYAAFPTGIMPEISTVIPCENKKQDDEEEGEEGDNDNENDHSEGDDTKKKKKKKKKMKKQKKDEMQKDDDQTDHLAPCRWDETRWRAKAAAHSNNHQRPKPFSAVQDPRYLLRPEAIESVFVLYRITGKADLLDAAWHMFEAVTAATRTEHAYSAIESVEAAGAGETVKVDSMESFWIAETLKYFYLIFSEPDLISLDDYVFNTEAHPLKLPKPGNREMGGIDKT
ncbi:hypothetical protein VTK26DRAFT_216 [Humicola hyalothermophila]